MLKRSTLTNNTITTISTFQAACINRIPCIHFLGTNIGHQHRHHSHRHTRSSAKPLHFIVSHCRYFFHKHFLGKTTFYNVKPFSFIFFFFFRSFSLAGRDHPNKFHYYIQCNHFLGKCQNSTKHACTCFISVFQAISFFIFFTLKI